MEEVKERYETHVYGDEKACLTCEYLSERPSDMCSPCQNYKGLYKLHSMQDFWTGKKSVECLRVPYGDRAGVKRIFGDELKLIDKTPEIPLSRPFKMVMPLYKYQEPAVEKTAGVRSGVLKSPPRSGKTAMGAAVIAKHGMKTLIMASQTDWLDNFLETFVGSSTQEPMTNIKKRQVGFAKTFEEFEKYDIALCTYQTFLSKKGKKLLEKIKDMFSVLMIDEIQFSAALEYSRVISIINARYKYGLSGTPERKDGLESIIYKVIGKVHYKVEIPRLRPKVEVVTPPSVGTLPQSWTYMIAKLEGNPARLKQIAEEAVKDYKAGHTILIPLTRVPMIEALCKAINKIAGKNIAVTFHGGVKKKLRKGIIDDLRNGKFRVCVGNSRMVSVGVNIPRASMLYQVSPSSNIPKADQRFSRILTPMPGKLQPVVKYWLDDQNVVRSCLRNEHWQCLVPVFKPIIDTETKKRLDSYFSGGNKRKTDWGETEGIL